MAAVWTFYKQGSWIPFSAADTTRIEGAFSSGKPNINLGPYWIDFMRMEQHDSKNPMLIAKVKRNLPTPAAAPAPAAATPASAASAPAMTAVAAAATSVTTDALATAPTAPITTSSVGTTATATSTPTVAAVPSLPSDDLMSTAVSEADVPQAKKRAREEENDDGVEAEAKEVNRKTEDSEQKREDSEQEEKEAGADNDVTDSTSAKSVQTEADNQEKQGGDTAATQNKKRRFNLKKPTNPSS